MLKDIIWICMYIMYRYITAYMHVYLMAYVHNYLVELELAAL